MAIEIERKFLVDHRIVSDLTGGVRISQGYVNTADKTVVRARVKDDVAYLTLKGELRGMTCSEFEYEIPMEDTRCIIDELCRGNTIFKTRYEIQHGKHLWEVDVFHGKNEGLIIAEVELSSEAEVVDIPAWVTEEVTGQVQYFNSSLLNEPYSEWTEDKKFL
ncbi:CYTH domain-containing protein [Microbulbifer sp. SSSA007]|uniref:CYTH domain-containing protein n=1 Tax=Microbulbifer sp. SSSA007 TaxID=3243379 RepID=UPI0040397032